MSNTGTAMTTTAFEYAEDVCDAIPPEADVKNDNEPNKNVIVGPITDTEAAQGGLVKIAGFMRTKQSKDALRKMKERKKLAAEGQRILTVMARDEDRETLRSAAARMIEDNSIGPAVNAMLANSEACELAVDMRNNAELREAIVGVWRNPKIAKISSALAKSPNTFQSLQIVLDRPDIVRVGSAVLATRGLRRLIIQFLLWGMSLVKA